jgi:hypothetical protein
VARCGGVTLNVVYRPLAAEDLARIGEIGRSVRIAARPVATLGALVARHASIHAPLYALPKLRIVGSNPIVRSQKRARRRGFFVSGSRRSGVRPGRKW